MKPVTSFLLIAVSLYVFVIVLFHTQLRLDDTSTTVPTDNQLDLRHRSADRRLNASTFPRRESLLFPPHCRQQSELNNSTGSTSSTFQTVGSHYVYSAYYDDRLSDDQHHASLRVIALVRTELHLPTFYCHVTTTTVTSRVRQWSVVATLYEMCENHAKEFGGWIVSCPLPEDAADSPAPCHVVISVHPEQRVEEPGVAAKLPVFHLKASTGGPEVKLQFAVCVAPLFGHVPSTTIVEFVEMTRLLGVQHVTFYKQSKVSAQVTETLDYYVESGDVSVIQWDIPVEDKLVWYRGQLLAVNDCLYRSMSAFQFVGFNDIDEYIVPHVHRDWASMLQALSKHVPPPPLQPPSNNNNNNNNASVMWRSPPASAAATATNTTQHQQPFYCAFSFLSTFFDPLLSGPTTHVLYDLESDLRTKAFSSVRTKVVVRPSEIFEVGIHHVSRPLRPRFDVLRVDTEVAFVHHYRKCISEFDYQMNCQIYVHDDGLFRFIPALRHNVHQTLWRLKERQESRTFSQFKAVRR